MKHRYLRVFAALLLMFLVLFGTMGAKSKGNPDKLFKEGQAAEAKGDWDKAHACVDSCIDEAGILVHAYLHRKEGDLANAAYWYGRVGRIAPDISLAEEGEALRCDLLASAK